MYDAAPGAQWITAKYKWDHCVQRISESERREEERERERESILEFRGLALTASNK